MALLLNLAFKGRAVLRTVVLLPYAIITVVSAITWQTMFQPNMGLVTNVLSTLGLPGGDVVWLGEHGYAMAVIVIADVWKTTPFMALLLLAGLALIPQDLLNAAQVDGAGAWKRLVKIILPLIKPAILVALLFRTLDAFRIFDNIYVLTGGANNTGSVSILGYDNLFKAFNLGLGSAISVLIFLSVAVIAFIYITIFGASAPGSDEERR